MESVANSWRERMKECLLWCLLLLPVCVPRLHIGNVLGSSLSVRNWDDDLVGLDSLIINQKLKKWNKGLRSKEEKLLAEKKHQKIKKRKSRKMWAKLMTDRNVYNNYITRGLIG